MTTPEVVVAEDALERLAARLGGAPALVVCDASTYRAAGERMERALAAGRSFVFPDHQELLAEPLAAEAVRAHMLEGERLVAVGSGVITDIVRYTAHTRGEAFLSVPTAASMDGYASSVAAMQIDGVKVTTPARAPIAIYADPRVVAAAPPELTRAGIGDLLGKATALVDWLAAHLLLGEHFDAAVAGDVGVLVDRTAADVTLLLRRDPRAARRLLLALIDSGLSITRVGSSRPASGCEHHASHFWDLLAARGRRAHHPHGLQVGYATHFAMRLQRYVYAGGLADLSDPGVPSDRLGTAARQWLGDPTEDILAALEEKRRAVSPVPASWPDSQLAWQHVCEQLTPLVQRFSAVGDALERAGIPGRLGYLGIDRELMRATLTHATRLRGRYTVIDLLEGQRRLEDALAAVL